MRGAGIATYTSGTNSLVGRFLHARPARHALSHEVLPPFLRFRIKLFRPGTFRVRVCTFVISRT